jgi:hypothetical protein
MILRLRGHERLYRKKRSVPEQGFGHAPYVGLRGTTR